ncbi:hypothetical protein PAXRUDRAFT_822198 [Paxillus rubicundulus Ve08.2h10]|uniref:DUF7702 domain-containing protein n=1 Tax=Paxillus rubicundulus Ve08.2h10 TaxID=930991 RepID=A0A0D0EA30_9AGAM|nr:hypothetical protein PAXRUDRAFT_822198 [Paxillus rubicundulus Ve08.2h10]
MSLDTQGILSAVVIAIYVPVLFFAFRISYKYGGLREMGWLLLCLFILIRIVGGALLVAAELIRPAVTGLYIGGYALEASGLSPLLLCTLGLLEMTTQGPDGEGKRGLAFRMLHLLGTGALVLTIIGISTTSSSSQSTANTERRIGVLLFAALYLALVAIVVVQWTRRGQLMKYRKQLLLAISAALPFLAVRALYSVLSTFSSSTFITSSTSSTSTSNSDNDLAKFNMFTGEWQIYLVMEILMEYAVVIIYTVAGTLLPLNQDYKLQESDEYPLYRPQY